MPVSLGAKPQHGFDQPLGLLSDCHRRIEHFLGVMIRVLERSSHGRTALTPEEREALERALHYFAEAAPRHAQDEEQSLFPRLRASQNPEALAVLARVEVLEEDHRRVDALHKQVHRMCRQWLDDCTIAGAELHGLLCELRETYTRHILLEDAELFPVAAKVLDCGQLVQIGVEMARRRGLRVAD